MVCLLFYLSLIVVVVLILIFKDEEKFSTSSHQSSSRCSSIEKLSLSLSSSSLGSLELNEFYESDLILIKGNNNEIDLNTQTTNNKTLKSTVCNSIESFIYCLISFFFFNKLQLFFQYLFMNYETEYFIQRSTSSNETNNYLNHLLLFITIILIMLTLYVYIFLIYFHINKIESQLNEIQKLFNS